MSSKKSLAARLLTRAFRPRPTAPLVRPTGPVGGRIEELEARDVPALIGLEASDVLLNANTTTGQGGLPHIAMKPDGTGFVVVWENADGGGGSGTDYGVYARLFNANWQPVGNEFLVNTTTAEQQYEPDVAVDASGNFTVVWTSRAQAGGAGRDVVMRRFNAAGTPLTGETLVNTTTASEQSLPSIAMNASGAFVVAWASGPFISENVFARTFDAAGSPTSGEIAVNTTTADEQSFNDVAITAAGNFVVTWSSFNQDATGTGQQYGVYARAFSAAGAGTTGEVAVNTTTAGSQSNSRIAVDSSGVVTIVWESANIAGGDQSEVMQRRFNSTLSPLIGETVVNTTLAGSQLGAEIDATTAGDYVVVWTSGSTGDIYARRYNSSGAALGAEAVVNLTTAGNQFGAAVGVDDAGDYVVAFGGTPAADEDVYLRRFGEAPVVQFTSAGSAPSEADGTSSYTVNRSAAAYVTANVATAVSVTRTGGTATPGTDFSTSFPVTVTIAAGSTSQSANVSITNDNVYEGNETIVQGFGASANYTIGSTSARTITVVDDETPPTVSIGNASVTEGDSGTVNMTFTVTLSGQSALTTTVNFATANGTAVAGTDYNAASGTVTFPALSTSQTVTVQVIGNTIFQANRQFTVNLSSPGNATIGTGTGTGTISDDDAPATITVSGGNNQNTGTGSNFASPLVALVRNANNNPVQGVSVTFTAPAAGASAVFSTTTNTITVPSNASGLASTGTFAANGTAGTNYTVTAAATGGSNPSVNFTLSNVSVVSLSTSLAGGVLTVTDTAGNANTFSATVSGANLVLTDANEQFAAGVGTLSNGNKTLTIPLASVTGLVINLGGGSDTLTLNYAGGALPNVGYDGGTGATDSLVLAGGTATTQTFNFTNEHDGSVVHTGGTAAGTITYVGLEPISSTVAAANVVLNYGASSELILVSAAGAQTQVDSSVGGETVTFDNPTALLEINAGGGDDTVNVTGFGTGFGATLDVDGEGNTDSVTLGAAVTYAAGRNLTVAAESITVSAGATQTLSGAGAITLAAGQTIAVSGNLTGGTGGTTLTALGAAALDTDGVVIGATVTATGSGAVTVTGTGGGGTGNGNAGVIVNGTVTSGGGNVTVTGTGGSGNGGNNRGVLVQLFGTVSAGGAGTVSVAGTGGAGTGGGSIGVTLFRGTVTSAGGNVGVTGTGGGSGASSDNVGVFVDIQSFLTAGGTGTVTVSGTGGAGTGGNNLGVYVFSGSVTAPAALSVTGTKGAGTTTGISVTGGTFTAAGLATLTGPGGSDILVDASPTVNFGSLAVTTTGSATVTEDSAAVLAGGNVGGTFTLTANGGVSQTAAVTAGNLSVTNTTSGDINLFTSANTVGTFAASNAVGAVSLRTGSSVSIGVGAIGITAAGQSVTLAADAGTVTQTQPITAGTLNLGGAGNAASYTLSNTSNEVATLTANGSGSTTYRDATGLALSGTSITGSGALSVTTGGAITQTAATSVSVAGLATFNAGSSAITLTETGNNFSTLNVTGSAVSVLENSGFDLTGAAVSTGLTVDTSATVTQSGAITGAGGLTKLGTGTLALSLANGYAGPTAVNNGTVVVSNATGLSTSAVTVGAAVLEINGVSVANTLALNNSATLRGVGSATYSASGNPVIASGATVTFATVSAGDQLNIGSGYANAGGSTVTPTVVVAGPGTVALNSGSGTFRGAWDVQAGTLRVSADNSFGNPTASGPLVGSTLRLGGGNLLVRSDGARTFNGGGATSIPVTVAANATISHQRVTAGAAVTHTFGTLSVGTQALTFTYDAATVTSGDAVVNFAGVVTATGNPTFRTDRPIAGTRVLPRFSAGLSDGGVARTITFDNVSTDGTEEVVQVFAPRSLLSATQIDLTGTKAFRLILEGASAADSARIRFANTVAGGAIVDFRSDVAATFNNNLVLDADGRVHNNRSAAASPPVALAVGTVTVNGTRTLTVAPGNNLAANTPYQLTAAAVTLNGNGTVQVLNNGTGAGRLIVAGGVSEAGGARSLTKTGAGTLELAAAGTYSGGTTLSTAAAGGAILASATNALGTGAVTVAYNTGATSAQLQLTGGITLPNAINTTGVGTGSTGIVRNLSGTNTLSGTISLIGGGGNSNYQADTGSTLVLTGTVGANAAITRALILQGAGDFNVSALLRDRNSANAADTLSVTMAGSGTATLSGANTYTQATTVSAGTLKLGSATALGTTAAGTTVAAGATLDLNGQAVGAEAVSLAGSLVNTSGSAASLSGAVTLTANSLVGGAGALSLSGNVGGAFGVTKVGAGTTTLSGTNAYTGATNVTTGTLVAASASALGTTAGGTTLTAGATLDVQANVGTEAVSVGGTGVGGLGALVTSTGSGTVGGAVTLTADAAVGGAGALTVGGAIGGGFNVTKVGAGTTTLAGSNTYTGTTTVSAGRLNVNGSVTSNVIVGGGVLGGSGTINSANTLTLNTGTVAPGNSPGVLNTGSVTFAGGTFEVEVTGTTVGTQYDQLNVTGTVTLGAGTTTLTLPTPTFTLGGTYTIINNDGSDNTTGYFAGLTEGAEVGTFGGVKVYITYNGGDGNDVQLLTTPTVNGTSGADTFVLRQVSASPGNYEISTNGGPFAPLGAITTLTINGQDGNDTLTIDAVNGNPFPSGGVTYNGGNPTTGPGDQLVVGGGTYATITHTFATASSGSVDFDGRAVTYTGLEPVLVNVGTVADVVFNLPAAASAAVLEDNGTTGDTLLRLRSTNGTFETTTFSNPTGSVTINRGNAADALTVTAVSDLTSSLTVGTGALPFQAVSVTGAVTLGASKDLAAFATRILVAGAIAADDVTLDADTGAPVAGNFAGVDVSANVTGTGAVAVVGRGGNAGGGLQHGVLVRGGASLTGATTTVTGFGGASAGGANFGVLVTGAGTTVTSGGGTVSVTGTGGGVGALGTHYGVAVEAGGTITSGGTGLVDVDGTGGGGSGGGSNGGVRVLDAGSTITSAGGNVDVTGLGAGPSGGTGVDVANGGTVTAGGGGTVSVQGTGAASGGRGVVVSDGGSVTSAGGAVTVLGTGGAGGGNANYGVFVTGAGALVTSGGGTVTVTGAGGGSGGSANNPGVLVDNTAAVVAPAALTVTGTKGANTALGVSVLAGTTVTAGGTATFNGPSASDVTVAAGATANFGSLTASAAGATVTVFEDSATAVNTVTATTINLTSAGAISDNNAGANNLTGTTATLAAAGGIDLDTTLDSLTATTSAAGAIVVREADAITLTSVSTADGNITVAAGGTVSAVSVIDALDAAHVVSITTTAGDILVGDVTATGDTVTLNAAGAIQELGADAAADVTADVINLTAATGIGTTGRVEIDTITAAGRGLTAAVTGTGSITLGDVAGGLRVRSATTANGSVDVEATAGDVVVETVTAGGVGTTARLATLTSGDILDDDVDATRVTASVVDLSAAGTVGTGATAVSEIDTAAAGITASGTEVYLGELDAVTLTSVTATAGFVVVVSGGTQTVTSVSASFSVVLDATAGDVLLGSVTGGSSVGVRAAGAITDNNGPATNVTAASAALFVAATGVGAADPIETAVTQLAGSNSTSGAFNVANTGSLAIINTVAPFVQTTFSAVGVTNPGGAVGVSTGNAGSNATLTVGLIAGAVVSAAGNVVLTSDGNYTQSEAVTSTGGSVTINADAAADADTTGAAVNINAPTTASTTATVNTGGDADTVTVTRTGATTLDVYGGGIVAPAVGFDQVTVVFGTLGTGFVRLNNSGSDNYHATVDGAAQTGPLTFHANTLLNELNAALPSPASGVRRVSVNAATVLDYNPAGATLTELSLLGGTAADTYYVQFTDPAVNSSLLPPLVNVAAAGGTADAAFVYGTNSADTIDVNVGDNDRVASAGVAVQYDGSLEALTVYGKDESAQPGDRFAVRPDQQTAVTIAGGTPLVYPGDTLELDVIGLVTLNPTLSDPALPDGTFSLTGYGLLSWTSIENFPVPRGLGGSFDFGPANGPVQFGFTQVLPTRTYLAAATEGTGWHGWATIPRFGNQAYLEPNPSAALAASPDAALLLDYAYGFGSDADVGVFRVDVAPNKPVQLTAILGIPAGIRDGQVVEWGVANTPTGLPTVWTAITPPGGLNTPAGEMTSLSVALTAAQIGNNLSLFVRFRDLGGESHWSVSALDVRPLNPAPGQGNLLPGGLVAPLPVRREFSTDGSQPMPGSYADQQAFAAVPSDGTTIDYYRGKDAIPGSLVTITVTNGTPVDAAFTAGDTALVTRVLNADAAGYVRSFQVQADANGEFTFGVRRPTGTATSTVTVADVTGFRTGAFTQAFALPSTRRLDFGPLPGVTTNDYGNGGTVGAGYAPFADATYTDAATNALGWATGTPLPVPFTPGGSGVSAVQQDGVFGGFTPSEFVMDMPAGTYVVTATLGDAAARRDDIFIEVFDGTAWVPAKGYNPLSNSYDLDLAGLTSPPGVSPNAGQSLVRTFLASTVGGQLRLRFGNVTGNPYWTLAALEARPAQATLTISRTAGTLTADGSTVTSYSVTGAAAGAVLTVRTALGSLDGTDANTTYDGFQVVVPPSGTATFAVKAPFSAGAVSSIIEVESVSGAERGLLAESYAAPPPPPTSTPAVRRFDFNSTSNDTAPGLTGVRGTEVWTTGADYGWLSAVGEFERATTTLPASMTAAQKSLFRDGATLGGATATFRVKVSDVGADYAVRYYVGDSYKKWPWIRLVVEGGTASGQLATNVNQYWSYVMFGKDADNDGYLDVKVFGSATWVLNAIDVAKGTTAAALPPSLFAPSPQAAAFTVTSGTAPKLTAAELAPVVAEAVSRWTAAGADPARLAAVTVSITDLNGAARLGEHVPGSVHIDDDAGGKGWFVDPTPADDAEFAAPAAAGLGATDATAARGVDLLTVVMHELGHELGLDDVDPATNPADLMAETLDVGVRRLPAPLPAAAPPVVAADDEVELPAKPTTATPTAIAATVTAAPTPAVELPAPLVQGGLVVATVATLPTPSLWLDETMTVYAPGVPVVVTGDRSREAVAAVGPVRVGGAAKTAVAPALAATPAWPDADALLDLDGVYVG